MAYVQYWLSLGFYEMFQLCKAMPTIDVDYSYHIKAVVLINHMGSYHATGS